MTCVRCTADIGSLPSCYRGGAYTSKGAESKIDRNQIERRSAALTASGMAQTG